MSEIIKQLLDDDGFIRQCYAQDSDSKVFHEAFEFKSFEKDDIAKAIKIVRSGKMNNYTLTDEESDRLQNRIFHSMEKRRRQKRISLIAWSAASCIAILLAVHYLRPEPSVSQARDYLSEMKIHTENIQTNIELNLSNEMVIHVADKGNISIDSLGHIQISNENKTETKSFEPDDKTDAGKMNTLIVPKGRRSSIVLEDGTKIHVNSGTVLMFPTIFSNDHRTVYVEGEIYLEVKEDNLRPFYVKTQPMDIRVLGTSFNVTTYKEENISSVVLVEGAVEIVLNTGKKHLLKPSERIVVTKDHSAHIETVNTYNYTSWINGVFLFENKTLDFILNRLSQYYNVTFDYPKEIANYRCSGKLVLFDDIDAVMVTLKQTFPLKYEVKEYKIILNSNK